MSGEELASEAQVSRSAASVDSARAALLSLLKTTKLEAIPTQQVLARKLKKELADLRDLGVPFDTISAHLLAVGIVINKKTLGMVVKRKKNSARGELSSAPRVAKRSRSETKSAG